MKQPKLIEVKNWTENLIRLIKFENSESDLMLLPQKKGKTSQELWAAKLAEKLK